MTDDAIDTAAPARVFFDATLYPNRSLGPFGFRVLMLLAGGLTVIIGVLFMAAGAWPVLGFCGFGFLLLYLAFRWNYRMGRIYERVRLTEQQLEVRRYAESGQVRLWRFEPTWVRVAMDDPPRPDSQLRLSSHGHSLVIGAFLTPTERLHLAESLRDAIAGWRRRWHPAADC